MPDQVERSLEASTLYMVAEILERKISVEISINHIIRLRNVADRMCRELEEVRLRRDIEHLEKPGPGVYFGIHRDAIARTELADVAPRTAGSSDAVILKRYLELDRCLE